MRGTKRMRAQTSPHLLNSSPSSLVSDRHETRRHAQVLMIVSTTGALYGREDRAATAQIDASSLRPPHPTPSWPPLSDLATAETTTLEHTGSS